MLLSETGTKQEHVILFVHSFFGNPCKFGNNEKDLYRRKKNTLRCLYSQSNEDCWKYEGKTTQCLNLGIFLLSRI